MEGSIYEKKIVVTGIMTIILLLGYFFWDDIIVNTSPKLVGTYQSETAPPNIIMISFFQDGTFEEYYNASLVDSGTYRKEKDSVYTLHSEKKEDYIILQEEDSFYYYYRDAAGSTIFLLKNLGKAPTKIIDDPAYSN
ncbi:hypothetical protein [uncultured Trichococcus sp.]|uniref:hypothetical protein n=1 Tax=uncultured Trichococcus sp. TaxID=189665 RepID=UPI002A18DD1F|nr:hypothetical protein [uncultured Trichococcus sp.]